MRCHCCRFYKQHLLILFWYALDIFGVQKNKLGDKMEPFIDYEQIGFGVENGLQCKFACNGCSKLFTQYEIKHHEGFCCFRKVRCPLCYRMIVHLNYLDHGRYECPNKAVQCLSCRDVFVMAALRTHCQECLIPTIKCVDCGTPVLINEDFSFTHLNRLPLETMQRRQLALEAAASFHEVEEITASSVERIEIKLTEAVEIQDVIVNLEEASVPSISTEINTKSSEKMQEVQRSQPNDTMLSECSLEKRLSEISIGRPSCKKFWSIEDSENFFKNLCPKSSKFANVKAYVHFNLSQDTESIQCFPKSYDSPFQRKVSVGIGKMDNIGMKMWYRKKQTLTCCVQFSQLKIIAFPFDGIVFCLIEKQSKIVAYRHIRSCQKQKGDIVDVKFIVSQAAWDGLKNNFTLDDYATTLIGYC